MDQKDLATIYVRECALPMFFCKSFIVPGLSFRSLIHFEFIFAYRFLKKLKTELPYDLAIPLLGIYLEKTVIQKDIWT